MGAGYKTLEFVLIDLHKGKPSRDLLHSLLDMLVDGTFQPSNMVIQVEFLSFTLSCLEICFTMDNAVRCERGISVP